VEVTITPLSDVSQQADIEISDAELLPHFRKAYEQFRPKAQFRGFRKGKVPLDLVKKLYGEAIEQEALEGIAEEIYRTAMEERSIVPIGRPSLVNMDFQRGSHFRFSITYEIKPTIELKQYRNVKLEKPVHTVTDEELERELLQIRRANARHVPVEQVEGTEAVVTADVQELDASGSPLIGKKSAGVKFPLYDESLQTRIREALAGARTGETYPVTLETQHEDHSHEAHFQLGVTAIERVELPEVNDEFARSVTGGKVTSAAELRTSMRGDLEKYWEGMAESRLKDALADEIVRRHEFTIPDSLVEAFLDSFLEDIRSRARDRKLPENFDEADFRKQSRASAVWQAKWMLLRERIAQEEKISVTDEDLEAHAAQEASRLGIAQDRLLAYYRNAPSVHDRLLSDKVTQALLASAKIKDVPWETPSSTQASSKEPTV
jgi:trigger factor